MTRHYFTVVLDQWPDGDDLDELTARSVDSAVVATAANDCLSTDSLSTVGGQP